MSYNRLKQLLFNVLELLRTELTKKHADYKDADSYIFSELDMTVEEIQELYRGSPEANWVYMATAIQNCCLSIEEQNNFLKPLYEQIKKECNFETIDYRDRSEPPFIYITEGCGVTATIRMQTDRDANATYRIDYDADDAEDTATVDAIEEVVEDLNSTCWDSKDWR